MIVRYFGWGEESVYGTKVAATEYVDPTSAALDPAADSAIVLAGISGIDRIAAAGPYSVGGDVPIPLDQLASPFFFKALLGKCTDTGTTDGTFSSTLSSDVAAGDTVIPCAAVTNAAPGQTVQIGTGATAEVGTIDTVGASDVTLEKGVKFAHSSGEAIDSVTGNVTHVFSVKRSPTIEHSFTARVGKDSFEHAFAGCVLSSLQVAVERDFAMMTLGILGAKDSKETLAASPIGWTDGAVFAPHEVTADVAGSDASAIVETLTLNLQSNANVEDGVTIGSRFPRRAYWGSFMADLSMTLAFADDAELQRYWGGATGPADTLTEFAVDLHFGANMDIALPRGIYMTAAQPVGGRDRVTQDVTFRALYDTGTDEVVQATVVNARDRY